MTDNMKPVRCGCGGEAVLCESDKYDSFDFTYMIYCKVCGISSDVYDTEAEAIEAWNRAMGGKTAEVIEHDASITDTDGNKYFRTEYLCGVCKKKVFGWDDYCSHCGAKLDWED